MRNMLVLIALALLAAVSLELRHCSVRPAAAQSVHEAPAPAEVFVPPAPVSDTLQQREVATPALTMTSVPRFSIVCPHDALAREVRAIRIELSGLRADIRDAARRARGGR